MSGSCVGGCPQKSEAVGPYFIRYDYLQECEQALTDSRGLKMKLHQETVTDSRFYRFTGLRRPFYTFEILQLEF